MCAVSVWKEIYCLWGGSGRELVYAILVEFKNVFWCTEDSWFRGWEGSGAFRRRGCSVICLLISDDGVVWWFGGLLIWILWLL